MEQYDYLIVGSGIAGLYTALLAREHGSVLILTKGSIEDCNTRYAQGGIAAPIGPDDSAELHAADTLHAGAGLCDPEAVHLLASEAAQRVHDLIDLGVPFDTQHGEIALAREGAHSVPRVLHAGGDATGQHIELTLAGLTRLSRITVLEYSLAVQVLVEDGRAVGVQAQDSQTDTTQEYLGRHVILATGGAGCLFRYTTNPQVATGDGVALAYQAGAQVVDLEFVQFHPTALRLPGAPPFLISEAVRGEGGMLRNVHGRRFMAEYAPEAELASRDVVARSIYQEMQRTDADHVLLDVTHLPSSRLSARFPTIYRFCLDHGLDITTTSIPVAPAAHYIMGGVRTNTWGQTSLPGLFACGEVACPGVHGANRLASNSLLETLVFGKRVMQRSLDHTTSGQEPGLGPRDLLTTLPIRNSQSEGPAPSLTALQELMWEHAGIIRCREGLELAAGVLAAWQRILVPADDRATRELVHLILLGRLLVEAALLREESRGAHFRHDFPDSAPRWERHIVLVKEA